MKKSLIFLIIFILITSCSKKNPEPEYISPNDYTSMIKSFYNDKKVYVWQDIATLFNIKEPLENYDYSNALKLSESPNLEEKAGYVISVSFLNLQDINIPDSNADEFIISLKSELENNYQKLSVKEIALCMYAILSAKIEYDNNSVLKDIKNRQNENGGFPASYEYKPSDVDSTAYALSIITLNRDNFSDDFYDDTVIYLSGKINNSNTLSDINGKESSVSTALTLNSLIAAGMRTDGEVATALVTAIENKFKINSNGYSLYAGGSTERTITGEIFLCYSSSAFGNVWMNLKENA